ncbi:MAG: ABC transporter substrate-binding protein [Bacteroidota bacterium]
MSRMYQPSSSYYLLSTQYFLLLVVLWTSCQPVARSASQYDPGLSDSTITIGSWGPLSGPAASWGTMTHAMDAYFQLINEEGGIHGRKIRFVYKDDGYNPARTVPLVRDLVEGEEVFALVGGLGTNTGMAVLPYIEAQQVPWVSPASGAAIWSTPPKEKIFATFGQYTDEAYRLVDYVVDSLSPGKLAIVYQNDDFGKGAMDAAQEQLAKRGESPATTISYELGEREMSGQAVKLMASEAEVVLLWMAPQQAVSLLAKARSLSYQPQWVASTVLSDMSRMHELTQGAWEGVIFGFYGPMPNDTTHPRLQAYREAFARFHPSLSWGAFAETGFIYAEPLVAGLQAAGPALSRERFVKAMEELDFQGIGPHIRFGPGQRQGHRSLYLLRCTGAESYVKLTDWL